MKKSKLFLAFVMILTTMSCNKDSAREKLIPGEKYLEMAIAYSGKRDIDSAKYYAAKAESLYEFKPYQLKSLVKNLSVIEDSVKVRRSVFSLNDSELVLLQIGKLNKIFLSDSILNKIFIEKMQKSLEENENWIREKYVIEQSKAAEARIEKNHGRMRYGEGLRNEFLDSGFDIKVKVYGEENRNLKLTFSLFNDVYTRKFQREGMLEKWVQAGFYNVEISDGYDYNVHWKLKKYAGLLP